MLIAIFSNCNPAKELGLRCQAYSHTDSSVHSSSPTSVNFIQFCINSFEQACKCEATFRARVILSRLLIELYSDCQASVSELLGSPVRVVNVLDIVSGSSSSSPSKMPRGSPMKTTPVKFASESTNSEGSQMQCLAAMILAACVESGTNIPSTDGKMNKSSLLEMVHKRIGLEKLTEKLDSLQKTVSVSLPLSASHPMPCHLYLPLFLCPVYLLSYFHFLSIYLLSNVPSLSH